MVITVNVSQGMLLLLSVYAD